jgi:hypothetical protein
MMSDCSLGACEMQGFKQVCLGAEAGEAMLAAVPTP